VPRWRGGGRAMVAEVLVATPAVRAVIREGKTHQIYSLMQAGQKWGMQTMNQALLAAIVDKKIAPEVALERSSDPNELDEMMNKVNVRVSI
jgi:twitching motility protein PilT